MSNTNLTIENCSFDINNNIVLDDCCLMERNLMTIENKKKIRSGNQSVFCQKYEENTDICTVIFLKIDIQWTPHADCSTEVKCAYFQSILCTLKSLSTFFVLIHVTCHEM